MSEKILKSKIHWKDNHCYIGKILIGGYSWDAGTPPQGKNWVIWSQYSKIKKEYTHYAKEEEAKKLLKKYWSQNLLLIY